MLAIAVPIVLLIIGNWISMKLEIVSKESDYKILEAKVGSMEKSADDQKTYIIKSFGEIQKTLFDIQLQLKDKEDRPARK